MQHHYKNHLSDFNTWGQREHAAQWVLFPENMSGQLCIDEVAISKGELYTILTNASGSTRKGSLIAIIQGTKVSEITDVLKKIPLSKRKKAQVITLDLAANMAAAARDCFPNANLVSDRFHVQQLPSEALQEMRVTHRWAAIKAENAAIADAVKKKKKYEPIIFPNGDTEKQLLARSRYILFKAESDWTKTQKERAAILFSRYPDLKKGYELNMMFRGIYQAKQTSEEAKLKLKKWYQKIEKYSFEPFLTAAHSIQKHEDTIVAFFDNNRATNALAETFNSKLKAFRAAFRGVTDIPFFIYRVCMIFS